MVHQHFMLVPVLTVVENVILGLPSGKGPFVDTQKATETLERISEESGLQVDPSAKVIDLPVGVQQRVEILKFLYRGAEILILDEPTAVLTPEEVKRFFTVLRQLQDKGVTIILITHKLDEVMEVSDRVTVLRKGENVATVNTSEVNREDLAKMMVGRDVLFRVEKGPVHPGKDILSLEDLTVRNDRGIEAVKRLSLRVREGEILGIAGVSGNGQEELADALAGVRRPEEGRIRVYEEDITYADPKRYIRAGMSQIPSDRKSMGLIMDFSIAENFVLCSYSDPPFARRHMIDWKQVREYGDEMIEAYNIKTSSPEVPASWLSGGNLQKLILARQISLDPYLLVAVQPTRGLDVGAIEFIHQKLIEERDRGKGILLISMDLDEILNISDRIAVMFRGEILGTMDSDEADLRRIALMMAGVRERKE
jgi:simple sugar transport system ATP-binding protein